MLGCNGSSSRNENMFLRSKHFYLTRQQSVKFYLANALTQNSTATQTPCGFCNPGSVIVFQLLTLATHALSTRASGIHFSPIEIRDANTIAPVYPTFSLTAGTVYSSVTIPLDT